MSQIKTLVADDHTIVREGIALLLRQQTDIEVVAESPDGEDAMRRIEELGPTVAVADIDMPRLTGIEIAQRCRASGLGTAVVLVSVHSQPRLVRGAVEAGARGYVVKEAASRELVSAVRDAAAGKTYLSPCLSPSIVGALLEPSAPPQVSLAPREREVLRLLASGLSSKEIATRLRLSVRTVDGYRGTIMRKLGIHHLPGLVKYAIRNQMASLDD